MNVPKLRFKEFSGEWHNCKIGNFCKILMCKRIFANETSQDYEIPFYKIGTIGKTPDTFISKKLFEIYKIKYNYPKKGELLITCSGTVGKCIIFDGKDSYFQDSNIVWLDNPTLKVSNRFLYYLLSRVDWTKLNSTTITRIYSDNLKQLKINYPEKEEQNQITNLLELLDKKIELQTKKIEALKLFKLCILKHIFSSATVKTKLKNISNIIKGKQINSEELSKSGSYYMLNGGTEPSGYLEKYNTLENTITISEGGNSCGYVKYNKYKFWCGGHCYSIKNKLINNHYLYQLLKFNEKKIMRLRIGSGLPNIQKKDLENFELFIHKKNNQYKIANLLMKYDTKIELEKNKLDKLTSLKTGLMQNMFI